MRPRLIVFVKEPVAGRVKTRLGRTLGMPEAAWWYRHRSASLIRDLSRDPRWETVAAISPDTAIARHDLWPTAHRRVRQGNGSLGDRMRRCLISERRPSALVGTDIPGITRPAIAEAFRILARNDTVLGPTPDGGYWLIGIDSRRVPVPKRLLENVRWSTEHAFDDTLASMSGLRTGLCRTLMDIDTETDLSAWRASQGRERRNR